MVLLVAAFPMSRYIPNAIISSSAQMMVGIVTYMFLACIVKDITRFFIRNKRTFDVYGALAVVGVSFFLTLGAYINSLNPRTVEVDVVVNKLPDSLKGFRIVQLTDLHVTPATRDGWLNSIVKRVNKLNPDIVVLTGDVADMSLDKHKRLLNSLRCIKSRYGNYFVDGNHEYYSNKITTWEEVMKDLGFTMLDNTNRLIEHNGGKILIAGVSDPTSRSYGTAIPNVVKAASNPYDTDVEILLAHQPNIVHKAAKAGFDIQLSGHTHGGQFFPFTLVVDMVQEHLKGLYDIDGLKLYVSQGTGTWGPQLRLGTKTEITVIELK